MVKLVFLGRLEDVAQTAERHVSARTLGDVFDVLDGDLVSALRGDRIRLALNGELVADRTALHLAEADELAFLPPVSGG